MTIETLGPYRIGKQIGRGGMGAVYVGKNVDTGDPAAVKVLNAALGHDEAFRERFEAEINTLRKLRHENIVRLFGFGEQDDVLFFAMELVEGRSLEEDVREGRCYSWREVAQLGIEVCRALKHAHDRGVIHRDIKPANLLVPRGKGIKLSDFGIAKLFGNAGLTAAGGVLGTAEYMAPEQADGRPVNHRCDLYSLGAVMYTLLAGRPPFVAKSIPELLQMQRYAEPEPLRRLTTGLPQEVEAIVMQLLEKDPERRPANATVLARRLESTVRGLNQILKDEPPGATGDTDFEVGPSAGNPSVGQLGETRPETQPPRFLPPAPERVDPLGVTQVTSALRDAADDPKPDESADHPAEDPVPTTRFTTVEEEDDRLHEELYGDDQQTWVSPQTGVLAAALVAIGLTIYYFLQPPSADKLYERIQQQTSDRTDEGVLAAEEDIHRFLQYYPNHEHSRKMEQYLQDIKLAKMEKRLRRALRGNRSAVRSPAQQAYLSALDVAPTDPIEARKRLQVLIDFYGGPDAADTGDSGLVIRLAQRRIVQLKEEALRYLNEHQALMQQQLARAEQLREEEPARAAGICEGLIAIYDDKAWAAAEVQRAREMLARLEALVADQGGDESSGQEP